MTGFLFVLIRVIASPLVNLFQKKLTNREVSPVWIVLVAYIFFSVLAIPYLIISGSSDYPGEFWIYVILMGISDAFGNMFLVRSLKSVDLSVFGPMNAYKPVVALILSFFIVGEIPSISGAIGVIIIVSGSYFLHLSDKARGPSFWEFLKSEGIGFRFLSIFFTSAAAVLSKKVILMSSPLITLSYWSLTGLPVILFIYFMRNRFYKQFPIMPSDISFRYYFGLLSTFLILQIFSLYTFKYVLIGYSLALFQLSAVISVFLGSKVFGEGGMKYRYIASLIMILGACIIIYFG